MLLRFQSNTNLIYNKGSYSLINRALKKRKIIEVDNLRFFLKKLDNRYQSFNRILELLKNEGGIEAGDVEGLRKEIESLSEDGYIVIKEKLKPTDLTIEVTKKCNERCKHCYIPNSKKSESGFLPIRNAIKVIKEFHDLGGERIIITGGEVFCYRDLLPLISYIHSLNIEVLLFSNLTLLTTNFVKALKDNEVSLIQTSLYGHNALIHNEITNLPDSFEKTIHSIKLLREHDIEVRVAVVLMKSNYRYLIEMIELLKSLDCLIGIELGLSASYDTEKTNLKERLDEEELKEALINLKKYDEELFFNTVKTQSREYDMEQLFNHIESPICDGGVDTIYLTCDNKICGCPLLMDKPFGSTINQSLQEILEDETVLEHRNYERHRFSECLSCEAYDYCKWCIGIGYTESGVMGKLSPLWCKYSFLIKEIAES